MDVHLERDDLTVLAETLERHIEIIQDELAHTEAFALQRALHEDIARLEALLAKLKRV